MKFVKSIWTTITGSISSLIPLFFACCKTGACTTVCLSPISSIFGISSATLIASPFLQSFYPLLLTISAVSFTISYYNIYVIPKYNLTNCYAECACEPKINSFQEKFTLYSFWIGLIASIIFFTYFEYQNYKANSSAKTPIQTEQIINSTNKTISTDTTETEKPCCSGDKKCE